MDEVAKLINKISSPFLSYELPLSASKMSWLSRKYVGSVSSSEYTPILSIWRQKGRPQRISLCFGDEFRSVHFLAFVGTVVTLSELNWI